MLWYEAYADFGAAGPPPLHSVEGESWPRGCDWTPENNQLEGWDVAQVEDICSETRKYPACTLIICVALG